jgi:nucleotide-binding universal stress UspA family protein
MFSKILVPLDGSDLAERALDPAIRLALAENGEIILLSIPYLKHMIMREKAGYGFLMPDDSLDRTHREMSDYLATLQRIKSNPNITMRSQVIEGDEAGTIVDTAIREEADLIVMSTHGRSGFSRWMMGSVTERVLRSAPCPVLVIRQAEKLFRLLIPLDGSPLAETALNPGLELAKALGARVTLLQVQEQTLNVTAATFAQMDAVMEYASGYPSEEEVVARASAYLDNLSNVYAPEEVRVNTAVVVNSAARGILEYAEANDISLIVMATHGYTGLRRWVYGSVTEKVLRGAHCAVMIIRPPAQQLKGEASA